MSDQIWLRVIRRFAWAGTVCELGDLLTSNKSDGATAVLWQIIDCKTKEGKPVVAYIGGAFKEVELVAKKINDWENLLELE